MPSNHASDGEEVFVISVAAELAGMHAQTLRTYDRLGLVTPARTRGGGRRYSRADVAMLQRIQKLSQEDGVNLAGIKAIIDLSRENSRLKEEVEELGAENRRLREQSSHRGELVHVPRSTAVVMWSPEVRRRRRR
ncbi:heat shock protein transcriptional repressor HspR [Corynebacterium uberis]|uniref:heat shock protein transcriptional repressor HspR n=1 Tax=Corynebacterium TaxID=1716 RepID=UPI001D0AA87B|nr:MULTISPECIES: helix-turn-helix transcriptional regulator [Corynebacterium]MCZ9309665.1 helix-turn-helix transcriptional regulator [Corynebacterium sp. c6VSa_13]UDL73469.1 helix-turn-helix transcriptional regulator [Corynebacterium uberis]UDL75651.1 helix-turn-helix transcriptional regulator [Corynebacterium uberis]UDL77864.1 helix-turn-helix transcriptional regulator [Corynebacterium uberis]UDL80147.1 helix-turn-helix transcriptional regulator [Corynebacterium uberis]